MRKIFITVVLLIGLISLNAQNVVSITEQDFSFASESKEVQKITFKDVNAKNLKTAVIDYFKKNYRAKVSSIKKTDNEFEVSEFKATDIQQKPTSAIFKIQELDGNAILYIHYKSDGYVVSSKNTPDLFASYKKMSHKIGDVAVAYSYEDVIELRKKDLSSQEKDLVSFVKSEDKK